MYNWKFRISLVLIKQDSYIKFLLLHKIPVISSAANNPCGWYPGYVASQQPGYSTRALSITNNIFFAGYKMYGFLFRLILLKPQFDIQHLIVAPKNNVLIDRGQVTQNCASKLEGILPKGPYLLCVSMAGRALLAGYHRTRPSLVQIVACHLFGSNLSSESNLAYCWVGPLGTNLCENCIYIRIKYFSYKKINLQT